MSFTDKINNDYTYNGFYKRNENTSTRYGETIEDKYLKAKSGTFEALKEWTNCVCSKEFQERLLNGTLPNFYKLDTQYTQSQMLNKDIMKQIDSELTSKIIEGYSTGKHQDTRLLQSGNIIDTPNTMNFSQNTRSSEAKKDIINQIESQTTSNVVKKGNTTDTTNKTNFLQRIMSSGAKKDIMKQIESETTSQIMEGYNTGKLQDSKSLLSGNVTDITGQMDFLQGIMGSGAKKFEEKMGRKMTYAEMRQMWG